MNITSKRLDKIKKTKNQSKRRIHYKNKKKNGKEKNRRKNRKYNKSTGKYRKTHKQKKRAYDLKNKSLKFKDNQPGKKSAPLKIITTDKPVETVQTGGGDNELWENFKKLFERANKLKSNEPDNGPQEEIRTYAPFDRGARVLYLKEGDTDPDTAVIPLKSPKRPATTAIDVFGDFTEHVETTEAVVAGESPQSGGEQEIYDMMRKYYTDKTDKQWNEANWVKLGKGLAGLITGSDKTQFLKDLQNKSFGEALQVATAMGKVLEKIDGENEMKVGFAYANKQNLNNEIYKVMTEDTEGFKLKAIIRGTNEFVCKDDPRNIDGTLSVDHFDSFVKIDGEHQYVYFDALKNGTKTGDDNAPLEVDINTYLPDGNSCQYLIFLFNKVDKYPQTGDLNELQVITDGNGDNRCWINATLYAVLFGIMKKKGKKLSEVDKERVKGEVEKLQELGKQNVGGQFPSDVIQDQRAHVKSQLKRMEKITNNKKKE